MVITNIVDFNLYRIYKFCLKKTGVKCQIKFIILKYLILLIRLFIYSF